MNSDNIKGIVGTLLFHALLLAGLLLMALRTPLPLPEEAGVEVNIGNSDEGTGNVQPEHLTAAAPASPASTQAPAREEVVTQETEEAPATEPVKKDKPLIPEKKEPKPLVKKEPEPQPVVNQNAMYKGNKGRASGGGNEGTTGKPGDQGKPNGTPGAADYDGSGGSGNSISFDLEGRSKIQIPRPSNNFKEGGIVVVTIFVNRSGNVTRVITGTKGTTTSSMILRQLAENAAKKAKFSPKDDAPEEQKGSITYIFELN